MKTIYILVILFLASTFLPAQNVTPVDSIKPDKGPPKEQLKEIKEEKVKQLSDTTGNEPKKSPLIDTTVQNKYGDLLNDDSLYNKRYPVWMPAVEIVFINAFILSMDRYYFKYDFATTVSPDSWKRNLQTGWEFDNDRFGINFSGHPYTGSLYFNSARTTGYNYFQSYLFSVEGSIMWEYFGENTLPSYNDLINTTVNGAFLGEVLYRLSSNILDDRTTGLQRVSRELFAGLIDPVRGLNRILQGKTFRRTNIEVYQKEPLNITWNVGVHQVPDKPEMPFGKTTTTSPLVNFQFDYGNPFEKRSRKPFDFFRLNTEFNFGTGRKILDNVLGYGILFGKNVPLGKLDMLVGGFQYYDYWDNNTFELVAIGLGGGVISKIPFSETSNMYNNIHIAAVPFGANSSLFGPDTSSQARDYTYNYGMEGKIETTLNLGKYITASLLYYLYYLRTYNSVVTKDYVTYMDMPGNNFVGILKPNITIHLFKGLRMGYEHYIYYNNRYPDEFPAMHSVKTEEKIFLQLYLEDKQRRGHYH